MLKKISPHNMIFLLITIMYATPFLLTLFFDINDDFPYIQAVIASYKNIRYKLFIVYVISISSFLLGSFFSKRILFEYYKINKHNSFSINKINYSLLQIYLFRILIFFTIFILVIMFRKGLFFVSYLESYNVAIVERNIYTVLCDVFVFCFVFVSINRYKNNSFRNIFLIGVFISIIIGSRMFIVPIILYYLIYFIYINNKKIKPFIFILCGILIFALMSSIFFLRHSSNDIDIKTMVLLIQYESIGVHFPLMNTVLLDWHVTPKLSGIFLFTDIILFQIPRFIFYSKNDFLFYQDMLYSYGLSPWGGMNGEASVIIYFGIFFPIVFFVVGALFSLMYSIVKSSNGKWFLPFYIYTCSSFIFSFLRNGILMAIKNLLTVFIVFLIIQFLRKIVIRPI